MFTSIVINKNTLKGVEVSLSSARTAENSEGEKFTYYWATLFLPSGGKIIACTGQKFSKLLGESADDDKLADVLVANAGKFEISQATGEDGQPIYINGDPDQPLLKIQATAHKVALKW